MHCDYNAYNLIFSWFWIFKITVRTHGEHILRGNTGSEHANSWFECYDMVRD